MTLNALLCYGSRLGGEMFQLNSIFTSNDQQLLDRTRRGISVGAVARLLRVMAWHGAATAGRAGQDQTRPDEAGQGRETDSHDTCEYK